jgi:DNA-binding MarR family transcriptional regulator
MVAAVKLDPEPSELMAAMLAILQTAKAVQASLAGRLELDHGLSLSEVEVLANLSADPQGMLRMSHLSDALVTNRPAITRLVDGLEAKGLVARRALEGDRRAVHAAITQAGRKRFREVRPYLETELRRDLGGVLEEGEILALGSALAKILARLGEDPVRYADRDASSVDGRRARPLRRDSGARSSQQGQK